MGEAFSINVNVLYYGVPPRFLGQKNFHETGVWNGHLNMEIGKVIRCIAAVMDFEIHSKRFGEMRDL